MHGRSGNCRAGRWRQRLLVASVIIWAVFCGSRGNADEVWRLDLEGVFGIPVILEDGSLVVHAGNLIVGIDARGVQQWQIQDPSVTSFWSQIAAGDGGLYATNTLSEDAGAHHSVSRYSADRTLQWRTVLTPPGGQPGSGFVSGPALRGGVFYIGVWADSTVVALGPDGRVLWRRNVGGVPGSATVSRAGVIYVPTSRGDVVAISSDGELRWRSEPMAGRVSSPVLGLGDDLFVKTRDPDGLVSLGTEGQVRWRYGTERAGLMEPVVDPQGNVTFVEWFPPDFFTTYIFDAFLTTLFRDGVIRNRLRLPGADLAFGAVIGADSVVYVTASRLDTLGSSAVETWVAAVSLADGFLTWLAEVPGHGWMTMRDSGDLVLATLTPEGTIIALLTTSGGMVDAPWAKGDGDAAGTRAAQMQMRTTAVHEVVEHQTGDRTLNAGLWTCGSN